MSAFNLADYEPVEDRLRAFWEEHPQGAVNTKLLAHGDGMFIVYAEVYRGPGGGSMSAPDATGHAMERETERGVNSTSALENCETSAIGRALANLGYAAKGKRPSREEMFKPARQNVGEVTQSVGEGSSASLTGPHGVPSSATTSGGSSSSAKSHSPVRPSQQGAPPGDTSGSADGEAAGSVEPTAPTSGTPVEPEGKQVEDPSGSLPATLDQWKQATTTGLTATRAKAIAKGLRIAPSDAAALTGEQLDRVLAAYLHSQEKQVAP